LRTISKKTKYALEALYSLSRHYGEGPILVHTVATEESIPLKFLQAILLELRNRGVVVSKKGRAGGYELSRPPEEVTVGAVIRMIEGPLAPLPCARESNYRRCDECKDELSCGTRLVMRRVRDSMAHILDSTTLADVIREVEKAKAEEQAPPNVTFQI
jgi:Rrf2 family protein